MVEVTIDGRKVPEGFFKTMGEIAAFLMETRKNPSMWHGWDDEKVRHGEWLREQFHEHEAFRSRFDEMGEALGLFEPS